VFGRIGAQTAKQIVLQRIRESERDQVFDQFASREASSSPAPSTASSRGDHPRRRQERRGDPGHHEPVALEHYRIGQNVKAFCSRAPLDQGPADLRQPHHKGFLKRLFELEVPGDPQRDVEIKAIAARGWQPSKVAVAPPGTGSTRSARRSASAARASRRFVAAVGREDRRHPLERRREPVRGQRAEPAQVISVDMTRSTGSERKTVPNG